MKTWVLTGTMLLGLLLTSIPAVYAADRFNDLLPFSVEVAVEFALNGPNQMGIDVLQPTALEMQTSTQLIRDSALQLGQDSALTTALDLVRARWEAIAYGDNDPQLRSAFAAARAMAYYRGGVLTEAQAHILIIQFTNALIV